MKQEKKQIAIRVNHLKKLYMENMGKVIDQAEIINNQKYDITDILNYTIISSMQNKALINIAIRGEVTTGKSTVAATILKMIIDELIRTKQIIIKSDEEYQEYLYQHIKSDQTEYLRFALEKQENSAVMIDEFSNLGETGLNATTEMAMYEEHSNLFAQRFVHKISCSPSHIQDKNSNIILDIIGKDTENGLTQVKVSYRDVISRIPLTLGTAIINVKEVINQPFYKRYRMKKFKRMDLLDKHGVRNIKELEFSVITTEAYEQLKEGTRIKKYTNETILSMVEGIRRKHKMVYSLLALNYVVLMVKSMLDLQAEVHQLERKIDTAKSEVIQVIAEDQLKIFKELLRTRVDEEKEKVKVLEQYRAMEA